MTAAKCHRGSATGIGNLLQADGAVDVRGRRSLSHSSHSFRSISPRKNSVQDSRVRDSKKKKNKKGHTYIYAETFLYLRGDQKKKLRSLRWQARPPIGARHGKFIMS